MPLPVNMATSRLSCLTRLRPGYRTPTFLVHRLNFASQTPRLWSGGDFKYRKDDEVEYTEQHVKRWKSWMGDEYAKYKNDELIAWRRPFDELSKGGLINVNNFMKIVKNKVGSTVPPKSLHTYAMKLWREWDEDQSNFIDFAEFIHHMKIFDMHLLKSALREESKAADTFETYKNPNSGKLDEDGLFEIMVANNFLVTTTTDAENILAQVGDGKSLSKEEFLRWINED